MTDGLVQFIRDRLDEDEREARSVTWDGSGNELTWRLPASATVEVGTDEFYAGDRTIANHIARHDPARVLADTEAKRRILAECAYWYDKVNDSATERHPMPDLAGRFEVAMPTLRLLALPFADHPDYREEWRPGR